MVQNFIEFVLLKEHLQSKFSLIEKRVNFLFDVQLKKSEEEDNLRCWVKLEGSEHDISRAKDYIIAVCSSRSPALTSLDEAVLNENNNTSPFDRGVTKQTPSVVGTNNHECNRDLFIQKDTTTSETLTQEKDPSSELISRFEDLTVDGQECANAANDKSLLFSGDNMVIRKEGNVGTVEKCKVEIANRVHEASDESLRDFAIKLGYSESRISAGLRKLGPSADKNSLLSELLKAESSVKQLEEGSSTFSYEKHRDHPSPEDSSCLRPIVIDGSNVAMSHGTQKLFSCRGIGIAVDWFLKRNHRNIKVFVPMWRAKSSRPDSPIRDQEVLKRLEGDGILVWTPSRQGVNGRIIKCYDDRYIIRHAAETDGVIVSNDNFRDLMGESHEWKKVIEQRLLMYTFVDDKFMPPDDPLGRHGPTLDEFLKKGCGKLCPYERNCTYGNRCKYLHPERNPVKAEPDSLPPSNEHLPPEVPYGHVTRPSRPLPPCPPEVCQHTRPLPPAPLEYHKPLPLPPQGEFPAQMASMFPPTLRTGQAVGIGDRRSDPLPYCKELPPDVQLMQEQFERTLSDPCFQDQACGGVPPGPMVRRGSLPHVQAYRAPPYTPGPPEIMVRGASMMVRRMPSDSAMVNGDWMLPQDQRMFGRHGFQQYPTHFPTNPPVSSPSTVFESHQHPPLPQSHWGMPPYHPDQPQYQAPQPHYYSHSPFNAGYGRAPYHGQRNGYFRSRAPPIIGGWCGDVTDNPKDGESSVGVEKEKLRIEAYEKLCEVFPDDVEKILSMLDKYSDETSVEALTQHMLDDTDP